MRSAEIYRAAETLWSASTSGVAVPPLRHEWPEMTIEQAYAIQRVNHERQLAAGERRIGAKIGLTAEVVQKQLGVDQPDFGLLFASMGYGDGQPIPAALLAQPKVEAEIAFVLKQDLPQPDTSINEVIHAIDYALPAIEVVGSRIAQWDIRITDTIADNASSGLFVLGSTPRRLEDLDLRLCGMVMTRRGEPVSTGAGSACLGTPLNAVLWLARTMARFGTPLRAGDLILSGALGPMVSVVPGDVVEARIQGLGEVRAVFAPEEQKQ